MSSLSWQIRDLASELLVRYFPSTFPEPIAQALFQLAQDTLGSPRVQEAEAGSVLMKTILQKYELLAWPSLPVVAQDPPRVCWQHWCFTSLGSQMGFAIALQWGTGEG